MYSLSKGYWALWAVYMEPLAKGHVVRELHRLFAGDSADPLGCRTVGEATSVELVYLRLGQGLAVYGVFWFMQDVCGPSKREARQDA